MRTRIALATVMAVSFMITSFDISTVTAQAATSPAATPSGTSNTATSSTGAVPGHSPSVTDLSINDLLWPQVIDTNLPAASTTTANVATPASPSSSPTSAPAPTPAPTPAPPPPPTDTSSTDTADWQCIRVHESGDAYNDPTRPSGAYGILESTWASFGYSGWPYEAAPAVQDTLALELYHEYGWNPWSTKSVCGLG
jgi:Transglycosylase-like domain